MRRALESTGKVAIILDDAECLVAHNGDGAPESHFKSRCQAALLALLDGLRSEPRKDGSILLLCTMKKPLDTLLSRIDRTFHLQVPNEQERRNVLVDLLALEADDDSPELQPLLTDIVESSVGRSYAELSRYCRHAMEEVALRSESAPRRDHYKRLLQSLRTTLLSVTPPSLREGVLDDYVEMRVMNAKELGEMPSSRELPFRGDAALAAWKELEASIVIPLCRSRELQQLIDVSGSESQRLLSGGILIEGLPGTGKTSIAMHCARYAASLLPSVKLLDVSCTSLVHKEVGGSERAIHHLFDCARRAAPCILLMDGIETVAAVRGNDMTTEGTLDRVLSTLLVELDGVEDRVSHGGIAVIGITQNAEWIDPALKRPGRLQKVVRMERK